ncbi:hypothetical protein [Parasulfitobacter algicola]|uniref:DoxX family protein n=1 Tax=Parasulfitobacter algicola TaxID=2614809 RepID=A0ABX2J0D1_9RHOB|nr:hypothetical protein [Sulfitobacter algicola]NSX56571.1 hypothetical protein [Sulfitobacter algicola]
MKTYPFMSLSFSLYWMFFWLLNGLDKFIGGRNFGLLTWHGKDRTTQFIGYYESLNWSGWSVSPILYFAGVVEILVALPFVLCIWLIHFGKSADKTLGLIHKSLFASFLVFIGFVIFDIIVGDRAELLEHSTYLVVIAVSYVVSVIEFKVIPSQNQTAM